MVTLAKRNLQFDSYEQLKEDVQELLERGYTSVGKWDLAQVCLHLNDFMTFPMDGFPKSPLVIRLILSLIRITSGRRLLDGMLKSRTMPSGKPTIPSTVYAPNMARDEDAVKTFLKTIDRWNAFTGIPIPSPVFGNMTNEEAKQLQLIHAQHHLSFLIPKR